MLVISRRIGESFLIGDEIEVTVVDITGEKVVLGVVAPREIPITRLDGEKSSRVAAVNQNGYARQQKDKLSEQQ